MMRIRALATLAVCSVLFALLLLVTHAANAPSISVNALTSAPAWSNFQPSTWVTGTRVTCSVQVANQDGLIAIARYRFSTNGGSSWSGELTQGLSVVIDPSGTTGTLTASNLALPDSADADQNQIKFSILDNVGAQWWSDAYLVGIDNMPANSTITTSGCYSGNWPGAIQGTARDNGSGVALVEITLRGQSDGLYYSGTSWVAGSVWLAATGTTSWSYPFSPEADSYAVQARATDALGQQEASPSQATFAYDHTTPQATVETAGCFSADTWPGVIAGFATDLVGGVQRVEVSLQRASDGRYYNGSSWIASSVWMTASGTTAWNLTFSPGVETVYTVMARAIDNCGNVQALPAEASFSFDNGLPQSSVQTSGCFGASSWVGAIVGSASDLVSGVELVEVTLQRSSDNLYYNGSSWGPSATWLPAVGTTSWSLEFSPPLETSYIVRSRATDSCGHVQTAYGQASFTYDNSLPQSRVTTSGCYTAAEWPGQIRGVASDTPSGVASIQVSIQRSVDSLYFNGSWWNAAPTWLPAQGTTDWSYTFVPPMESAYSVRSRATDNCGNVQSMPGEALVAYDTTAPSSAIATVGTYGLGTWPGAIRGTAADVSSGIVSVEITLRRESDGLYYNGSSWAAGATWLRCSGTTSWSFIFVPDLDTTYFVQARAADSCGNLQSSYASGSFRYDVSVPDAPTGIVVSPQGWATNNSFTVVWTNPGNSPDIARAHYKWNSAPTSDGDEDALSPVSGVGINRIDGLAVPGPGQHRLYLWLEDSAGNTDYRKHSATADGAFRWDALPPVTSVGGLQGTAGCDGWYTTPVVVGFSAVDATSGISRTFWRIDGSDWQLATGSSFTVEAQGSHIVELYSIDLAGNVEDAHAVMPAIKIDSQLPVTTDPAYTGTLGRNGWYVSPVAVSLGSLDATSGISETFYKIDDGPIMAGTSFVVDSDGVHTLRYYSVDRACNQEATRTAPTPVRIDTTPPLTLAYGDGPKVGTWYTTPNVTVTLNASDVVTGVQTSGVEFVRYRIGSGSWQQQNGGTASFVLGLPAGQKEWVYTLEYYATDLAGNIEGTRSLVVGIDTAAPGPTPRQPIISPAIWSKTNCFTISWELNPDDRSGIAGVYYSFAEPSSAADGTLVLLDDITKIDCVQVPEALGDGAHSLYLWLQDQAGNADHRTRREATLRLDRTPPELQPNVAGVSCGTSGWYNSCVTVTFGASDVHSGMTTGVVSYRVNSGEWVVGSAYVECRDGVYRVDCQAVDGAGNASAVVALPQIRLDRSAPDAPLELQVEPDGWSRSDTFALSWLNPGDLSGLTGIFWKLGSPPVSNTDGSYLEGVRTTLAVIASHEGELPLYLWLKDKACNSDHTAAATSTIKYDATPPTTTHVTDGNLGGAGWYVSEVVVNLQVQDAASGWAISRYRLGTDPWQSGSAFAIGQSGTITFSYYSVDVAGNIEDVRERSLRIDREAPASYAHGQSYSPVSSFLVSWDGSDTLSGLASFDVQYRVGVDGTWQDWVLDAGATQKSRLFTGAQPGKTYYFRSRAVDNAGNIEAYPSSADVYVSVDPLYNGDFEQPLGSEWQIQDIGGQCRPVRGIVQSPVGGSTYATVLGCPNQETSAAVGASMVCQTINVPGSANMPSPMISFRYRIFTYDVLWSQRYNRFYDSFNVGLALAGAIAPTYVYTDGNPSQNYGVLTDLGWRAGAIDVRAYAGRELRVCFANITRVDTLFNTWTYIDDVRIVNLEHRLHLPIVKRTTGATSQAVHLLANDEAAGDGAMGPR